MAITYHGPGNPYWDHLDSERWTSAYDTPSQKRRQSRRARHRERWRSLDPALKAAHLKQRRSLRKQRRRQRALALIASQEDV